MGDKRQELLDEAYLERVNVMSALVKTDAGITFLRWLCQLTTFNRPTMTVEDAYRRDVWINIRPFIPVDKLSEIEHHDLRKQQMQAQEMIELMQEMKRIEEDNDE